MVPADKRLTLLVPGLLGPWRIPKEYLTEQLPVPALEDLLSRARGFTERWADDSLEDMLFRAFGIDRPASGDWPVAAVTRLVDGGPVYSGWHLRADPVHLQADLNKLRLAEAGARSLSPPEAAALVEEINDFYRDEGWSIEACHPTRWYVRLEEPVGLRTTSVRDAAGADLSSCLPEGPDQARWRRRFNEIQMILHQSPVNQTREARNEPSVNSVWFWGGGALPKASAGRWKCVWSDDPLAQGLAALTHTPWVGLPDGAEAWLSHSESGGEHLVILTEGRYWLRLGDVEGWREYLCLLEDRWMSPLQSALARRKLNSLTLLTGCGRGFELTRLRMRGWWRRRRALRWFLV